MEGREWKCGRRKAKERLGFEGGGLGHDEGIKRAVKWELEKRRERAEGKGK